MTSHFACRISGVLCSLRILKFLFLLLLTSAISPDVNASTVELQNGLGNDVSDGVESVADTLISEDSGSANCGSAPAIGVGNMQNRSGGNRRLSTLMRFNLAPLAGKTVTGPAKLSLAQVNTSGGTGDSTFDFNVFAVSQKNADWIAGTSVGREGDEAANDEATWKFKAFPGMPWAGAPGLTESGMDYEAEPVATLTYKESDGVDHVVEIPIPAALIQKWIDHPGTNGGILIAWQSGDRYLGMFRSSEYWVPAQRPKLLVDYKK